MGKGMGMAISEMSFDWKSCCLWTSSISRSIEGSFQRRADAMRIIIDEIAMIAMFLIYRSSEFDVINYVRSL